MGAVGLTDSAGVSWEGQEDLVALFFFFDFFQKFLSGLTLDAEFCKGHGFQTPLADFDAALRTDPVCPFVEPGERFIDGLPPSIAHFHERYAQFTVQIHERLIADIAGRFEAALLIFRQGLS